MLTSTGSVHLSSPLLDLGSHHWLMLRRSRGRSSLRSLHLPWSGKFRQSSVSANSSEPPADLVRVVHPFNVFVLKKKIVGMRTLEHVLQDKEGMDTQLVENIRHLRGFDRMGRSDSSRVLLFGGSNTTNRPHVSHF